MFDGMTRVYCTACGQTYFTDTTTRCTLCGKVDCLLDPQSAAAVRDLVSKKVEEGDPLGKEALAAGARLSLLTVRVVWWGFGGLALLAFGGWLVLGALPQGRFAQFSARDLLPGLGAIFAGLVMLCLVVYLLLPGKRRRTGPASAQPPDRPEKGEDSPGP